MVDCVPACHPYRIPPRGIWLVAEHYNVLWVDAQPLACLVLDFFDAALVSGNCGEAFILRQIPAVHKEIIGSTGMNGNILESRRLV